MDVRALGYIGLAVADLDAWRAYAEVLGVMVRPRAGDGFAMKIDERPHRVLVGPADGTEGLAFAGWELADSAALDAASAELEAAGHPVTASSEQERRERKVRGMVHTRDPAGFRTELFWGPVHDHSLFVSPVGMSGFTTDDMGLGHVVLGTPQLVNSMAFYTGVLGLRVSDYMGDGEGAMAFLRCNPRHHSLALVPAPRAALYHFMLEARTLDDVGYALDRHDDSGVPVSLGLGRHTNDHMVSFYSRTPSGFDVELGYGGRRVDEATWSVSEITRPSTWGHRPRFRA